MRIYIVEPEIPNGNGRPIFCAVPVTPIGKSLPWERYTLNNSAWGLLRDLPNCSLFEVEEPDVVYVERSGGRDFRVRKGDRLYIGEKPIGKVVEIVNGIQFS